MDVQALVELELPHLYHSVARNSPKRPFLTEKWGSFQVRAAPKSFALYVLPLVTIGISGEVKGRNKLKIRVGILCSGPEDVCCVDALCLHREATFIPSWRSHCLVCPCILPWFSTGYTGQFIFSANLVHAGAIHRGPQHRDCYVREQ